MNIFLDTEFTHLQQPLDSKPPQLISIGLAATDGREFYSESADFEIELCSDFTSKIVLPLLEGGDVSMTYSMLAKQLKAWIEDFDEEVVVWTDAPYWDWMHIRGLFAVAGWPANLVDEPQDLKSGLVAKTIRKVTHWRFFLSTEHRQHHALDDARANCFAFILAHRLGAFKTAFWPDD